MKAASCPYFFTSLPEGGVARAESRARAGGARSSTGAGARNVSSGVSVRARRRARS